MSTLHSKVEFEIGLNRTGERETYRLELRVLLWIYERNVGTSIVERQGLMVPRSLRRLVQECKFRPLFRSLRCDWLGGESELLVDWTDVGGRRAVLGSWMVVRGEIHRAQLSQSELSCPKSPCAAEDRCLNIGLNTSRPEGRVSFFKLLRDHSFQHFPNVVYHPSSHHFMYKKLWPLKWQQSSPGANFRVHSFAKRPP